jgi:hypothetical protein
VSELGAELISGNLRRPRRYSRGLVRMFCLSAQVATVFCPESKRFYQRKRAEQKQNHQRPLPGAASTCSGP